jgi:hypothetical protein
MIATTRLSSVWQVAGVAAAALCCYLVSQSVAAERAGLTKVDREISRTQDEIARLSTELGTRGRMEQLESWNTQVLGLKAPRPRQFVSGGTQLVALFAHNGRPALQLDPNIVQQQGDVTKVSYKPAPAATPTPAPAPDIAPTRVQPEALAPAQPLLRTATYVRPKPERLAPDDTAIQHAAYHPDAAPVRKASTSSLSSLLPPDIDDIAAAERGKGKRAKADR